MSRLSELIRDLCPDGVEYRPLGEVAYIRAGSPVSKNFIQSHPGPYPVYNSGRKPFGYVDQYNVENDPIGIASRGAGVGSVSWCEGKYYRGPLNYSVTVKDSCVVGARYLYHYLLFSSRELRRLCSLQGIPALNKLQLQRMVIAVPPLGVQQEIVRILDQFTTLEAELKARRKQYEYYRDLLIESCDRTGEGLLGDISSIFRGASPRPIRSYVTRSGDVPWIKIGDVGSDDKYVTHTAECITSEGAKRSRRVFPGNFILSNSMSFGRPYISKIEGCVHDGWLIVSSFDEAYISDFLYHLLRSSLVQMSFRQRAGRGTVRNLNVDIVAATQVPLVPLEEQKRVLRLLDRFDALVNDISSGLPAEIAARHKQYEYYRNMVLTFPERRR